MANTRQGQAANSNNSGDENRELRTKRANDPPRRSTRAEKGKGIATSSKKTHSRRPSNAEVRRTVVDNQPNSQAPWPRQDGTPFSILGMTYPPTLGRKGLLEDPSYQNRKKDDGWSRFNSICYNGLLRVQMVPTRFLSAKMLDDLGIYDEVLEVLPKMGFGKMATKHYPIYPEFVRQFLASCEVFTDRDGHESVSEGCLTYMIQGIVYEISIRDLCRLYGFDEDNTRLSFPDRHIFRELDRLWNLIGAGPAESRSMKLALIRNPVIRIIAKALSLTLFCKTEPGALRLDELFLLHCGLPESIYSIYQSYPTDYHVNLGAVFAQFLSQRKFRGLDGKAKTEMCGSLLTPIFLHHGIDISETEVIATRAFLDMQHLIQSRWIIDGRWQYTGLDGLSHSITLPSEFSAPTSIENVRFDPPVVGQPDDVVPLRTRKRRNIRTGSDDAGPSSVPPPQPQGSFTTSLPPYEDQYAVSPVHTSWSDDQRLLWHHRSLTKIHTMISKVWGALSCTHASDAVPLSTRPSASAHATAPAEDSDDESHSDTDPAI